jgi:hypothetical protein
MYYFFIAILVGITSINITSDSPVYLSVLIFAIVPVIFNIITHKYSGKEIYKLILLLGLVICIFFYSGIPTYLLCFIVIAGAKDVNYTKVFQISLYTKIGCLLFMVLGSYLGIVNNHAVELSKSGALFLANDFGYGHINTVGAHVVEIVLLLIVVYFKKLNIVHILFVLALILWLYISTRSRTACISSAFILFISLILKKIGRNDSRERKKIDFILKWLNVAALVISIIIAVFYTYNSYVFKFLDTLMTGRFSIMHQAWDELPLTLFGTRQGIYKWGKLLTIDNVYINMLFKGGFIVLILSIYGMKKIMEYFYNTGHVNIYICLGVLPIIYFSESYFLHPAHNVFICCYSLLIYDKNIQGLLINNKKI